jgi:hypothetical protein
MKNKKIKQLIVEKSTLVEKIHKCWANIYQFNSRLFTNKDKVNVKSEYNSILSYEKELQEVKLVIAAVNMGLKKINVNKLQETNNGKIYRRSAICERAGYLEHLKLKEGIQFDPISKKKFVWKSTLTKQFIIGEIKKLKDEISRIDQDILVFNETIV